MLNSIPYSLFPIPHSPFPVPCSLFPVPCSLFPKYMNIKYFPIPLSFCLALGSFLLILDTKLPAQAQLSDITGAIITTSDIADGIYSSQNPQRVIISFRTSEIAAAVNRSAVSVNERLVAGNLPVIASNIPTTSLSKTVQQDLQNLLTRTGNVNDSTNRLTSGLVEGCSGVDAIRAQNLVRSLEGLTSNGTISPAQLRLAVEAYNNLINATRADCLSNPPEELLAIQSVLSALVNAALRAQG